MVILTSIKYSLHGERMRYSKMLLLLIISSFLFLTAFQCTSTEITSAKLYIQQKNYDKALEVLNQEIRKNPNSAEGYYWLAVVHSVQENYEEMVKAADRSVEISNEFEQQLNDLRLSDWAKTFNQGAAFYKRAVDSQNEDSVKLNFDRSATAFKRAIIIMPDSADTYKNLAFVYINANQYDQAVEPLKTLISKDNSVEGYRLLGEIYYLQGNTLLESDSMAAMAKYNDAIKVLEEGRKLHPNDQEILIALSNAYIAADKTDVALDAFKTGVEQDPNNEHYRYNYGVLLLGMNEYEAAEEQFKRAVEIDPAYANALYNLGVTYVRWGTYLNKQAEERGDIQNTDFRDKYQQALTPLEKVVELKQEDAATWEILGRVYTVLGMDDKAKNAFQKADELR
jgi:tetratricopeptide (TPR) repeat protein